MYIKVRVITKSKEESVKEIRENRLEIRVKEKAERNMANKRICSLIAERYSILPKEVKIVSGHHHPTKLLSIPDE
tara:strand:+ start:245 stop:469 length:225 start_codon:yes stop_codon:yes gene_type:complete